MIFGALGSLRKLGVFKREFRYIKNKTIQDDTRGTRGTRGTRDSRRSTSITAYNLEM